MIASADDARLLFSRWQEESPHLRVKLTSSSLIFDGVGTVLEVNPSALQIGGESWHFTVPLEGATFSFSDPREVTVATVRREESERYEFGLSVKLESGDELILLELKDSAETEEDDPEADEPE